MAIHDVTASLTASATTWQFGTDQSSQGIEYVHFNVGVPIDTPQTNAAYEYVTFSVSAVQENASGAEFVYGEVNNYLRAVASMTVDAFVQSVFVGDYGAAAASNTTLLQIPYPANSTTNDLILAFTGGKDRYWYPWNTTFTVGAHSWQNFTTSTGSYQYYSDPYVEDAGHTLASVFQRYLTDPISGNIDFTLPTPSAEDVMIGRALRITKSASKDWNVQHYIVGEHYSYSTSTNPSRELARYGRTNPFTQTSATQNVVSAVGYDGLYSYVCATTTGRIAYSNNAAYWRESSVNPLISSDPVGQIIWGGNKFILLTSTNKMMWSTDGNVWTQITNPFSSQPMITWNGEYFLGISGTTLRKSYDGINWALKSIGSSNSLTKPEYGGGMWITSESTDTANHNFWYSLDGGETWTRKNLGDNITMQVVYYGSRQNYSNYYGVRPNGTGIWQWTGGWAFGLVTSNDPVNGPFYYDQGDYTTPFQVYHASDGGTYYYGVRPYAKSNTVPTMFMQAGSDNGTLWQAILTDSVTSFPSWGVAHYPSYYNNSSVELLDNYIGSNPVHTNKGWLIPAGTDGVVISQYNGSNAWADIDPGDLLIFQLVTTFNTDVTTAITISMAGVVLGPITWIPDTSSSLGYNARQYIGYAYVISGAPTGYFMANWSAPKLDDRSSTMTLTRIRSEVIPNDIKAYGSLTADGVVAKTGCFASATLEADAFVEGTPRFGANIGYNYNEVDGNSIGITSSTVIPAGSLLVITYASDNFSGTLPTITVTDNIGAGTGSWVTHVYARQGASAAGGVTTAIAAKYLTVATSGSYTVTVTLSNNVKAKVCSLSYYTNVYNNALTASAVGATSATSVSLTSSTQSVLVGASGWENESIYSSVPSGWYSISATRTGTGGNAATHIYLLAMYRITFTAGSYTYNPVLAGNYDWGNALVEFRSGHKVGSIMRVTPTFSATADVHEAVRSGTEPTTITASLTVVDEHIPATGSVVVEHAHADLTADSVLGHGFTAQLEILGTLVAEGSVPQTHLASVMTMSASVNLSAVSPIEVAALPTIVTANTLLTPIIDIDTDPVVVVPPPPPEGDETWGSADGVEPEFGPLPPGSGFGNIIEITNRTYSDLYETQRRYRNNDENDRVPYQMQAAQGKVASIGGGRALCMHVQENSWYVGKFDNAPAMLVATVINAGSVNPAVVSQRRYELPIHMRGFATTDSSIVELPDGGVIYTVTGMVFEDFDEYSANINLDEGMIARDAYYVPGPLTIATRIDVSGGGNITYTWVKKWGVVGTFNAELEHGGDWSGLHWGVLCVTDDGYPIYETISAYYVAWTKVDPVTGAWIEHSNNAETTGWHSVTVTDGSNAALLHEDYNSGRTWYTTGSIDTMQIDPVVYSSENVVTYKGRQLVAALYRLGSFPDPLATIGWLGNGTTAEWSPSRSEAHLFKWAFNEDGIPYVATTYMADNVLTDDLRGPGHGNLWTDYEDRWYENYGVAEDDTTPWVYYYGNNYDTSSVNWLTAVPCGQTGYSYVYLCNELASLSAEPRRSMGVHCTYNLAEADDDGKAGNWYTPPVGNTTWDSYFQKTYWYPTSYSWYCNTHAQTMDNGNIVILLTATNNQLIYTPLSDDWADQWENGETRAFVCIVQGGEAPPLKLTQRDDDKREGAARIAYVPVNGDSQRIGSETY